MLRAIAWLLVSVPLLAAASDDETVIEGIVKLDVPVRLKSAAVKVLLDGGEKVAFVRTNGYFSLRVKPGSHYLHVSAVGAKFPQVNLRVSKKHRGRFKATIVQDGHPVSSTMDELTISAIAPEVYFEPRPTFNIWSIVKSPVGIISIVMLVGVFILPQLTEGMDPEEVKQMQEQMRQQPSLTSFLSGASTVPASGGRS